MIPSIDRRQSLAIGVSSAITLALPKCPFSETADRLPKQGKPFRYCLNTSTIRGQKLSLTDVVEIAAEAGYDGIEPWIREIRAEVERGVRLKELRTQIADAGLTVENAIGFAQWIVDDEARRKKGLETAKRDMELVRAVGGRRIAAPPAGAANQSDLDLSQAGERYRELLELGESLGVVPQLEVWGFSKSLSRLSEVIYVAAESGHASACILPDVYHLYKGGSDFAALNLLAGNSVHVLHMNDYPGDPPRESLTDAHRLYPGEGVAPLDSILSTLHSNGFRGVLSLELFNPDYWKQDALTVAKNGLHKMKQAVASALA